MVARAHGSHVIYLLCPRKLRSVGENVICKQSLHLLENAIGMLVRQVVLILTGLNKRTSELIGPLERFVIYR